MLPQDAFCKGPDRFPKGATTPKALQRSELQLVTQVTTQAQTQDLSSSSQLFFKNGSLTLLNTELVKPMLLTYPSVTTPSKLISPRGFLGSKFGPFPTVKISAEKGEISPGSIRSKKKGRSSESGSTLRYSYFRKNQQLVEVKQNTLAKDKTAKTESNKHTFRDRHELTTPTKFKRSLEIVVGNSSLGGNISGGASAGSPQPKRENSRVKGDLSPSKPCVSIRQMLNRLRQESKSKLKATSRNVEPRADQGSPKSMSNRHPVGKERPKDSSQNKKSWEAGSSLRKSAIDASAISFYNNEDFFRHHTGSYIIPGKISSLGQKVGKIVREVQRNTLKGRQAKLSDKYLILDKAVSNRDLLRKDNVTRSKTPTKHRPGYERSLTPVRMTSIHKKRIAQSYLDIDCTPRMDPPIGVLPKQFAIQPPSRVESKKCKSSQKWSNSLPKTYFTFFDEEEAPFSPPCFKPLTSNMPWILQGSDPFRPLPCPSSRLSFPSACGSYSAVSANLSVPLHLFRLNILVQKRSFKGKPKGKVMQAETKDQRNKPNRKIRGAVGGKSGEDSKEDCQDRIGQKTVRWKDQEKEIEEERPLLYNRAHAENIIDSGRVVKTPEGKSEDRSFLIQTFTLGDKERVETLNSINRMKMKVLGLDKKPDNMFKVLPRKSHSKEL